MYRVVIYMKGNTLIHAFHVTEFWGNIILGIFRVFGIGF